MLFTNLNILKYSSSTKQTVTQELEEEEDSLNREFGAVCADLSSLQQTADHISHEIVSLTALLETASGSPYHSPLFEQLACHYTLEACWLQYH